MIGTEPIEVIHVDDEEVACDGGKGALGHPCVYLHIDRAKGYVTCPYCSKQYVHSDAHILPDEV